MNNHFNGVVAQLPINGYEQVSGVGPTMPNAYRIVIDTTMMAVSPDVPKGAMYSVFVGNLTKKEEEVLGEFLKTNGHIPLYKETLTSRQNNNRIIYVTYREEKNDAYNQLGVVIQSTIDKLIDNLVRHNAAKMKRPVAVGNEIQFVRINKRIPFRPLSYPLNTVFVLVDNIDRNAPSRFFVVDPNKPGTNSLIEITLADINYNGYFVIDQFFPPEAKPAKPQAVSGRPVPIVSSTERRRSSPRFHNQIKVGETVDDFLKRVSAMCLTESSRNHDRLRDHGIATVYDVINTPTVELQKIFPKKSLNGMLRAAERYANQKPRNYDKNTQLGLVKSA